jgi:3-oxo-5-alpha-steroid 4-dehydrogenase 1
MLERHAFDVLLWSWLALAAVIAPILLFVTAPYGRHLRRFGPTVPAALGWILMEAPAPLLFAALFVLGERRSAVAVAFLIVWEAHYLHRAFVFPLRRPGGRPMPLVIALFAFCFNFVNAYLNGRWLFTIGPAYEKAWLTDPRFLVGVALFLAGLAVNVHADEILRRLRRPGETGYTIPQGGFFRLVSSPNYLGEIVEWCGFALATFSLPGLSFALWTMANLVPRALAHHRWYQRTFPDYPPERKAIVPGIY